MDQVITFVVDTVVVRGLVPFIEVGGGFVVFGILWVAFGYALVASQGSLDAAWQWVRDLPLVLQALVWLFFLPVMLGLWIWETTWHVAVRVVLVAGIAGWNLLVFLPKWATAAR